MSSTFSMLKRVAATAQAAVTEAVHKMGGGGVGDEQLNAYKARLEALDRDMTTLKDKCGNYSKCVMNLATSAGEVSNEFRAVYSKSAPRQTQVTMFATAQQKLDEAAFRAYSIDSFGSQVLGVLDDWLADSARVADDIHNAEAALEEVQKLQERVQSSRQSKERRQTRGESNPKEDQMLAQAEEMLVKYEKNFATQRAELDKKVNSFVDGRYSVLDSIFVRFMELQSEFAASFVAASQPFQSTTTVYRKKFPLGSVLSPRSSVGNGIGSPTATSPVPDVFARAASPDTVSAVPTVRKSAPPTVSVSRDDDSDSDEETDSEEDDSSEEESDDDEPPQRTPSKNATSPRNSLPPQKLGGSPRNSQPSSPSDAPDLLNFGGASQAKSEGDLFYLFSSGAPAGNNKPPSRVASPVNKSQASDDPLDMFDFGVGGGKSPSPPPAAKKPVHSASSEFDPFYALNAKPAPAAAKAAAPAPIKRDPSKTTLKAAVSTADLDTHIENKQEESVKFLQESEAKAEEDAAAKKAATLALEDKLNAWSTKDGQRKPIRSLLSSLQTVLWPNSGWKNVGLADLIDLPAIKKAHRKAILIVHPDKVTDGTAEQKVIADHCFDALNSAFERFQETGQ